MFFLKQSIAVPRVKIDEVDQRDLAVVSDPGSIEPLLAVNNQVVVHGRNGLVRKQFFEDLGL